MICTNETRIRPSKRGNRSVPSSRVQPPAPPPCQYPLPPAAASTAEVACLTACASVLQMRAARWRRGPIATSGRLPMDSAAAQHSGVNNNIKPCNVKLAFRTSRTRNSPALADCRPAQLPGLVIRYWCHFGVIITSQPCTTQQCIKCTHPAQIQAY